MRFINKYFLSEDIPLEARAFNLVAGIGALAVSMATFITCLFMDVSLPEIIIYCFLNFFIIAALYLYNRIGRYGTAAAMTLAILGIVFTPLLYLTAGGVESGITSYTIMITIFIFFMLSGKKCAVMVALEILTIGICMYAEYKSPNFVKNTLGTQMIKLCDNWLGIFIVSMFIGITIKFQAYLYAREREKVETTSRAKSEFLATMSHEIRTPLNAIIGLSEIELQNELPPDTYSDIEKIYNSGTSLLGIINDILDISKIETGNLELAPIAYDTPSLINDVVQLNIVRIDSKPITFGLHIDPTIPSSFFGDEMRIRQILNNLLSNAFKYTQEGRVTLRATWKPNEGDFTYLTFIVSDTGIGIRKSDMGKLFSKYSQLDAKANRSIEGTGLGLAITKKLLTMMDGTISVESVYHEGSTFTVKLPQAIVNHKPIGEAVAKGLEDLRFGEGKNRDRGRKLMRAYMPYGRVLVVDDVATNLDVARGLLLPYGLQVDCSTSGSEAIDIIRGERALYDVILMDHMMPEMDGIEATRIIRTEIGTEYANSIPIVALTANAVKGNEEMFLANGFDAFISKPIDIMRLDTVLNQLVRDKQTEETLRNAERKKPAKASDESNAADVLLDLHPEGVDARTGIKRYGSAITYLKVLTSYAKHTPELLPRIKSVSANTLSDYAVAIHGLKGASYGICADTIGNRAAVLELAAKKGEIENVADANPDFVSALEKVLSGLEPLLGNPDSGTEKKTVMPVPDSTLLKKIQAATKNFDTSAMEQIISELERYEYEHGAELVTWLRERMDDLDYEAIGDRLGA